LCNVAEAMCPYPIDNIETKVEILIIGTRVVSKTDDTKSNTGYIGSLPRSIGVLSIKPCVPTGESNIVGTHCSWGKDTVNETKYG
jgi:hypothetical protein